MIELILKLKEDAKKHQAYARKNVIGHRSDELSVMYRQLLNDVENLLKS